MLYVPQLNQTFKKYLAIESRKLLQRLKNLTSNSFSELQELHKIQKD